jgi:protein-arginine deiminase
MLGWKSPKVTVAMAAVGMVTVLVAGCGKKGEDGGEGLAEAETEAEVGTEAETGEESDTGDEAGAWEFEDVIGVINSDDDDLGDKPDWLDPPFSEDDDLVDWVMPADVFLGFADGHTVELVLGGANTDRVRMWHRGAPVIGHDVSTIHTSYAFTPGDGDEVFAIEFNDYHRVHPLTINHLDADGAVLATYDITLRSAPLIMNHHLQPAEFIWAVSVSSNASFINSYQTELGNHFASVLGSTVGGDVWIQDEIEFGTATAPTASRTNVIIDSIRDRGLNNFPDQIVQPNMFKQTWGIPGTESSADSFGNLEATPPITVGGVEYPFGRIYYGKIPNFGINDVLSDFLESQSVQDPVQMNTAWLCVGHVDEFSSFVPDPSSAKGFKALLADVDAAYAFLEGLDPNMSLPRYENDHGFATVGEIVNDGALRALNEEMRDDYMNTIRQQFLTEFGLEESDIINVPTLFEEVSGCGGGVVALMPGMVNLIVANFEGETPQLFVPDPFFRTNLQDQGGDPLLAAFADSMPEGLDTVFIDNWYTYHMALGEVHCGTNVLRTPIANWWEVATHLTD